MLPPLFHYLFCLRDVFFPSSLNAIWRLVAGERFDRDDPKIKSLMAHLDIIGSHRVRLKAMSLSNKINQVMGTNLLNTTEDETSHAFAF